MHFAPLIDTQLQTSTCGAPTLPAGSESLDLEAVLAVPKPPRPPSVRKLSALHRLAVPATIASIRRASTRMRARSRDSADSADGIPAPPLVGGRAATGQSDCIE